MIMETTYKILSVDETKAGISVETECSNGGEVKKSLLSKEFWTKLGFSEGDVLSEAKYDIFQQTVVTSRAVARAMGILSGSDHSRGKLIHRLMKYGFDRDTATAAADYAVDHGYIKEDEQTKRIAAFYSRTKHWGKKRIAAELIGRGYCKEAVVAAVDSVSEDEYFNSLMTLVERKYPEKTEDPHEYQLRIAALSRMGYNMSEIRRAFSDMYDQ
jgi:SOS response regulatory protein OraA/RecX